MPLGDLEAEVYHKVLVVGADAPLQAIVREHLRETDDFRIETAASGFEAGIRAESFHPDCIVIDLAVGRIEAGQIAQNLRRSPDHISTILIALTSDEPGEEVYSLGFNDAFKKRWDTYPSYPSETAYTAVHALKKAVEKAKSVETGKVIEALEGMELSRPAGPCVIRKEDHQAVYAVPWGQITHDSKYPMPTLTNLKVFPADQYYRKPPFAPVEG